MRFLILLLLLVGCQAKDASDPDDTTIKVGDFSGCLINLSEQTDYNGRPIEDRITDDEYVIVCVDDYK